MSKGKEVGGHRLVISFVILDPLRFLSGQDPNTDRRQPTKYQIRLS